MAEYQPPSEQLQAPIPCDGCKSGAPGKHYCTICKKTMCNYCNDVHANLMKDHQVVPRSEIASSDLSICGDHPDENMSRFCIKCQRPVCIECMTVQHNGHKVMKLSALVEEKKLFLRKQISDVDQQEHMRLSTVIQHLQANEEYNKEVLSTRKKEICSEAQNITNELDQIKSKVQSVRDKKLQELTEKEKDDTMTFKDIREQVENRKQILNAEIAEKERRLHMCHDNPVGFLQFVEMKVSASAQHATEPLDISLKLKPLSTSTFNLSEILQNVDLSYIPIPPLRSMTVIKPQIVSSFKAKINGLPSLCTTSDGHAWIGGNDSRELIKVDVTGKIHHRKRLQYRVGALASMASGDIIIVPHCDDSRCVIRLGLDGSETVISDTAPSCANSVSVNHDETILICVVMGKLMRCNSDGSYMQEIRNTGKKESVIHTTELPDKTICVSDWTINGLVVIDKEGQQITTITQLLGRSDYKPRKLACDKLGNILSVDCNIDSVYIMDQCRRVKELLGASHGVKQPLEVHIAADDNLWIAQKDGTITVVKYLE